MIQANVFKPLEEVGFDIDLTDYDDVGAKGQICLAVWAKTASVLSTA